MDGKLFEFEFNHFLFFVSLFNGYSSSRKFVSELLERNETISCPSSSSRNRLLTRFVGIFFFSSE